MGLGLGVGIALTLSPQDEARRRGVITGWVSYGCRLDHIRLQAGVHTVAGLGDAEARRQ